MDKTDLNIIILAAGKGKRMGSELPKVLHPLAGKPLLSHVITTAEKLKPKHIFVIYGNGGKQVREHLNSAKVTWVEQKETLGTGHAVQQALPQINDSAKVLILYGDVPLISAATLKQFIEENSKPSLAIITATLGHPFGFGRIIRQKKLIKAIVEERDATAKQREIKEINTGIMLAKAGYLKKWLKKIKNHNQQHEYYLTDVVALAVKDKVKVGSICVTNNDEIRGINTLLELAQVERIYQYHLAKNLMAQGVKIIDPHRFDLRGHAEIESDVMIDANVILEGEIKIAAGSRIGANCILKNVVLDNNVIVHPFTHIEGAKIKAGANIGPFARIRPETEIGKNAKIGNFVEIKKSSIGDESKASHLSYIGDAIVGEHVNLGCGTITVNYDGLKKYQTKIEDYAFVGCDSQLIAPITIGHHAYIGAGTTLTKNAPANQLTLSPREKQKSIAGWKPRAKKIID